MKETFIKMFYTNKSLKNKIIPVVLSLLLLLTAVSPLFTSKAYAQNFPVLSGITYLNMPEKTFGGETTQCKLTITNFNLNKNKFSLSGILSYSNRNYPLNIEGTLYKSRIGKNNFVALAKDTTNTFDVLHFSILFNPNKHFLVTKKMRDFISKETTSDLATQKHLPLITIYLKRKNTREVSFAEGNINTSRRNTDNNVTFEPSFQNITNDSSIDYGIPSLDFFSFEIFTPLKTETKLVQSGYFSVVETASNTNDTDGPYETTYTFSSPYGNGYTMYGIYYKARCFSYDYNDLGFFSYRLWNLFEFTKSYDNNWNLISSSNDSPFSLGSYSDPVSVTVGTNGAFSDAQFNYGNEGQFEERYTPDIELSVGLGSLTASISMTADYNKGNVGSSSQAFQTFQDPNSPYFTKTTKHSFYNTCLAYGGSSVNASDGDRYVVAIHNYEENVHPDLELKAEWKVPIYMYAGFGQFSFYETKYLETYVDVFN